MEKRSVTVAAVDVEALEREAEAAVAAATTPDELDETRVRYLGRKSELKQALRAVRDRESGMTLNAVREIDEGSETVECPLPALVSAGERLNKPIRVGPADAPKAEGKTIETWAADALGAESSQLGVSGSPTWVDSIYSIEMQRKGIMLDGADLRAAVQAVIAHTPQPAVQRPSTGCSIKWKPGQEPPWFKV